MRGAINSKWLESNVRFVVVVVVCLCGRVDEGGTVLHCVCVWGTQHYERERERERERESRRKNSLRGLDSNCLEARVRVKGRTVPGDASRNWIMIS